MTPLERYRTLERYLDYAMPYEQVADPVVALAPMLVGELRPNDNGDKPTAVFVDGELVAVFAAGHHRRANAYAEHLKGGA